MQSKKILIVITIIFLITVFIFYRNLFNIVLNIIVIIFFADSILENSFKKNLKYIAPNEFKIRIKHINNKKQLVEIVLKYFPYFGGIEVYKMISKNLMILKGNNQQIKGLLEEAKKNNILLELLNKDDEKHS